MAVSKHNLWKRKKNGLMKLVRSHSDWLEKRRLMKTRTRRTKGRSYIPTQAYDPMSLVPAEYTVTDSTKRTQIGKKI